MPYLAVCLGIQASMWDLKYQSYFVPGLEVSEVYCRSEERICSSGSYRMIFLHEAFPALTIESHHQAL